MTNEKIYILINRLIENTKSGKTTWETTARTNSFASFMANYSVIITEDGPDYTLTILDDFDDLIERINDDELSSDYNDAIDIMRSLFSFARRNARGADKAIDDILNFLD